MADGCENYVGVPMIICSVCKRAKGENWLEASVCNAIWGPF